MRRLIVLAMVAFLVAAAHADPAPPDVALADLGLHVIGAGIQRTVAPRTALQLDLDYYSPWTELRADGRGQFEIVGAVVRARVFVYLTAAPTGWWLSPFVQGGVGRGDAGATGLVGAAGAAVGYAWLFGRFELAIGLGAQYHFAHVAPEFSGFWPHADLNLGYAF